MADYVTGLGRPTATVSRVDVSPARRASAVPASSEDRLFAGYSRAESALVTLPCACGGDVTADPDAPSRGVAAHQFTGRHKAWREANDL